MVEYNSAAFSPPTYLPNALYISLKFDAYPYNAPAEP